MPAGCRPFRRVFAHELCWHRRSGAAVLPAACWLMCSPSNHGALTKDLAVGGPANPCRCSTRKATMSSVAGEYQNFEVHIEDPGIAIIRFNTPRRLNGFTVREQQLQCSQCPMRELVGLWFLRFSAWSDMTTLDRSALGEGQLRRLCLHPALSFVRCVFGPRRSLRQNDLSGPAGGYEARPGGSVAPVPDGRPRSRHHHHRLHRPRQPRKVQRLLRW